MRILLQQKNTGLYLKEPGVWVPNADAATDFLSSTKALAFCAANKIGDVQLVLKFQEQHYDIVLPTTVGRNGRSASVARS